MSVSDSAVIYLAGDHIGTLRRLLIDVIDTAIVVIASLFPTLVAFAVLSDVQTAALVMLVAWSVIWTLYFVILKGSRFRTVGYVLAGARIVNLRGERPGYVSLLGRLAFAVLGPFNFFADLLWVSSDPCRQALRDKFAHTYVIRRNAVPVQTGRIVYRVYFAFGMTLQFAEVKDDTVNAA
jgi:uncharacterized RDD family membrane protein YckC